MAKQGEGLLQTLISVLRDANIGLSSYRDFPFVQDETGQSHLLRIIDFWNTEMWDETLTIAISKEVILTLLQCAARLYEDRMHARIAVDLIESNHTRAILSLGIQDVLYQVVHRRCIESIRHDKSDEKNAESYYRRADLFSAIRKNKARQLNHQAMIFKHISSLCRSYGAALQNTFDSPRIDEQFMFHNYVTISTAFNRYEKSWLVILFPDIFQWQGQEPCSNSNKDGFLVPRFGAVKDTNQDASSNASRANSPPLGTINVIRGAKQSVNMLYEKPVSLDSVEYLFWSLPWGEVCGEWRAGNPASDLEPFTLTSKGLEFEKGEAPHWKGAIASALKRHREFQNQTAAQKQKKWPVGMKIERKDAGDYQKEWKDGLLSPFGDILDDDWDLSGSEDNNENIFPFSPDSHNEVANRTLMPNLLYGVDNEHYRRIPSTNGPSLQSSEKDSQQSSQFLEPGKWMRGHQNARRLWMIPEEPQGQLEVEERQCGQETALKMADASSRSIEGYPCSCGREAVRTGNSTQEGRCK